MVKPCELLKMESVENGNGKSDRWKNDYFTSYFNFLEDVMDICSKTNSICVLEGRSKTKTQHSFVFCLRTVTCHWIGKI